MSLFFSFALASVLHFREQHRLISATSNSKDSVTLLRSAGFDHIPVNPSSTTTYTGDTNGKNMDIPASEHRPTVDAVIAEIKEQTWYNNQIIQRRSFDAKEGRIGGLGLYYVVMPKIYFPRRRPR
jgi:DEAD/DEAH box helicase domain-containing protein